MSDESNVIVLPVVRIERQHQSRGASLASVRIGPKCSLHVYAANAAELGTPLVELRWMGDSISMSPERAGELVAALNAAIAKARS